MRAELFLLRHIAKHGDETVDVVLHPQIFRFHHFAKLAVRSGHRDVHLYEDDDGVDAAYKIDEHWQCLDDMNLEAEDRVQYAVSRLQARLKRSHLVLRECVRSVVDGL